MNICEKVHRQKSVELETIETREGESWLSLKLLAYPVKKQTYPGKLAFVVYYEYETCYGYYANFDERSGDLDRFLIDSNYKLNDLSKTGELALILRSRSYQEIRSKIIQVAILDSVNQKPLTSSMDNIKWFVEHRDEFSKRQIGINNFTREKKASAFKPEKNSQVKLVKSIGGLQNKLKSPGLRKFLKGRVA